jgi:hypothetical protein
MTVTTSDRGCDQGREMRNVTNLVRISALGRFPGAEKYVFRGQKHIYLPENGMDASISQTSTAPPY